MNDENQKRKGIPGRLVFAALAAGLLAGFSAPGWNQWYLGWLALVPLMVTVSGAQKWWNAALMGWAFGVGLNLIWLTWFLKINLPPWVGIRDPQQMLIVGATCWIIASVIYGTAYGWATLGWWLANCKLRTTRCPALLRIVVLSLVFCFIVVFIADKPDLLMLPLSALEYGQYKNLLFVQAASLVGGAGLMYLMVLHNAGLSLVLTQWLSEDRTTGMKEAWACWGATLVPVIAAMTYGTVVFNTSKYSPDQNVFILQSGFMQDVMRTGKGVSAAEVMSRTLPELNKCASGLVVWTETSLPMPFDKESNILAAMREVAKRNKLDIVFGIEEKATESNKLYNAAAGITSEGEFCPQTYRKQYLIPFGEFEPLILRVIPGDTKKALKLPDVPPFLPGDSAGLLSFPSGNAAPLICGENVESSLCARSIRAGGNVITNISNLSWFQESILADQTIAMATIRAVENRRYYVYAADTGPSFVLDPLGKLTAKMNWLERGVLSGKFQYLNGLTPFTRFCP